MTNGKRRSGRLLSFTDLYLKGDTYDWMNDVHTKALMAEIRKMIEASRDGAERDVAKDDRSAVHYLMVTKGYRGVLKLLESKNEEAAQNEKQDNDLDDEIEAAQE